jgi:GGDEF domain-containing protein
MASRPVPLTGHRAQAANGPASQATAVLDAADLEDTIERIGSLAPNAPLSFLVVRVDDLTPLGGDEAQLLMRLVSGRLRSLVRATDMVGRMGSASFGVLLQGTGTTAAGAVAARLSHHLSQVVRAANSALSVRVSAATGTGVNWNTLPVAACEGLPDPA